MRYKFLVFSDLHITNKHSKFRKDSYGVSDLIRRQLSFVNYISDLTRQKNLDKILFLGDLTDYSTLDPVTLSYTSRAIQILQDNGLIMIEGNHCISDVENNFTVLSALEPLIDDEKTNLVYHRKEIKIGDSLSIHCVPYSSDYKETQEYISSLNSQVDKHKFNLLLFHFPCSNALLDNGLESIGGVELRQEFISNFDLVLGGDFHKRQKLIGTTHAYYVGAPFDLKHGEHDDRGALIVSIDTESKEYDMEHVRNPHNMAMIDMDYKDIENFDIPDDAIVRVKNVPRDVRNLEKKGYSMSFEYEKREKVESSIEEIDLSKLGDVRQALLSIVKDDAEYGQRLIDYFDLLERDYG